MTLDEKIEHAKDLIAQAMREYRNPIAMSSFGKDSMVMLDILKSMGLKLPVLFHRQPFEPKKYVLANAVIEQEDYAVYDYPPTFTQIGKQPSGYMEIANRYQIGPKSFLWLAYVTREPVEGKPFLCGFQDLYNRPFGGFAFPWDVCFIGHKDCDRDPLLGPIPLKADIHRNAQACDYVFPLRNLTDADVWEYIERFAVPYNDKRYDRANGYREFEDITYNNDNFYICTRCLDRDGPKTVHCPKLGEDIVNIGGTLRYAELGLPDYIGKS